MKKIPDHNINDSTVDTTRVSSKWREKCGCKALQLMSCILCLIALVWVAFSCQEAEDNGLPFGLLEPDLAAVEETIRITGNDFPFTTSSTADSLLEVRFSGNVTAQIVASAPDFIEVIVPSGGEDGPLEVLFNESGLARTTGHFTYRDFPNARNVLWISDGNFIEASFFKGFAPSEEPLTDLPNATQFDLDRVGRTIYYYNGDPGNPRIGKISLSNPNDHQVLLQGPSFPEGLFEDIVYNPTTDEVYIIISGIIYTIRNGNLEVFENSYAYDNIVLDDQRQVLYALDVRTLEEPDFIFTIPVSTKEPQLLEFSQELILAVGLEIDEDDNQLYVSEDGSFFNGINFTNIHLTIYTLTLDRISPDLETLFSLEEFDPRFADARDVRISIDDENGKLYVAYNVTNDLTRVLYINTDSGQALRLISSEAYPDMIDFEWIDNR